MENATKTVVAMIFVGRYLPNDFYESSGFRINDEISLPTGGIG